MLARFLFFFQAEDGIRGRSPSRGLGDVYKRTGKKIDRVRIHAPENNPDLPSTANTNNGWVLRIHASRKKYFDDSGKILGRNTDETHIPIKGNPNAN